jgi:hypothetical protein
MGLAAAGFAVRSAFADAPDLAQNAPPAPLRADQPAPLPPVPKVVRPVRADDEKKPDEKLSRVSGWVKATDSAKGTLTVKLDEGGQETALDVAAGAKVLFAGKVVKLDELKSGMRADVFFPPEPAAAKAVEVRASWPGQKVKLNAFNVAQGSITFALGGNGGVDFPVTLFVVKNVKVTVDGLAAGVADLPLNRDVELHLSLDKTTVVELEADGDAGDIPALVKRYDAAAQTLLVEFEAEANDRGRLVTLCLPVNATAKVRLAGSDAKLTDLQERMPVRLKMTSDRKAIAGVLAAHPLPPKKDDDDK